MVIEIVNKKSTDMELALSMVNHIKNPCFFEDGEKKEALRMSYIIEAKNNVLLRLTNPFAIKFLQDTINQYK